MAALGVLPIAADLLGHAFYLNPGTRAVVSRLPPIAWVFWFTTVLNSRFDMASLTRWWSICATHMIAFHVGVKGTEAELRGVGVSWGVVPVRLDGTGELRLLKAMQAPALPVGTPLTFYASPTDVPPITCPTTSWESPNSGTVLLSVDGLVRAHSRTRSSRRNNPAYSLNDSGSSTKRRPTSSRTSGLTPRSPVGD